MQAINSRQQVDATVEGFDQYGNPIDISSLSVVWSDDDSAGDVVKPIVNPATDTATFISAGPAAVGSTKVSVQVTDAAGAQYTDADTLSVVAAAPPVLAGVKIAWGIPTPAPVV
jgi:hypothetical protein